VFDLNLHEMARATNESFTVDEKHGGEYRLVLTKSGASPQKP